MQITLATAADLPRLCELLGILFEQEAEFAPDAIKQAQGLSAILGNPAAGQILVLKEDGRVIGMVNLLYTISTFLGGPVAVLEDLIIDPEHRGKGAGTFLLKAAVQHARDRGCRRLTLLTDTGNGRAQNFYVAQGFIESAMKPYRMMLT